jgi:polysaccharide biosynthesis protein PslG
MFGLNTNTLGEPWPPTMVPMVSWRSLGSQVKWADINTGSGVYDFSKLDAWLTQAKGTNTDVLFTAYATPSWASSRGSNCTGVGTPNAGCLGAPNTSCAFQSQNGPGICDPPIDLACDGTGTDQNFIDFISAMIQHVGPGVIKYWEMWNEPNNPTEWNGNADCPATQYAAQIMLARMARDLKATVAAVDSNAQFTTPAADSPDGAANWLSVYFAQTDGGSSADIVAFHGYVVTGTCPTDCPIAENVGTGIDDVTSMLPVSEQGKPLFDTEGSWGDILGSKGENISTITDPDQQASFLARFYLLQLWKKVAKVYWWNWDIEDEADLFDTTTNLLTTTGDVYIQVAKWTNAGAATVGPCSATGTVWTCTVVASDGANQEAIWDTSQTCSGGVCTTTVMDVPSQFNTYLDLSGNETKLSGSAPVGLKPILLVTE